MAVDTSAALRKLQSGSTLTAEEKAALGIASTPVAKTVATMTQEEKDAATAATIAAGGKSTDAANRLPGETASAANARITAGYKEMLAQPILSQEAEDAGAKVQFVRTEGGGVGSYTVVTPIGYTGPKIATTEWTAGIIPSNSPYTTGTTLGVMSDGKGGYTQVGTTPVTTKTGSTGGTGSTGSTGGTNGTSGTGGTQGTGGTGGTGNTSVPVTLVSTETDEYGNTVGWYSDGSNKILVASGNKYKTTVDEDAYAILAKTFADYGLDDPEILKAIQGYMERGLGSEQAGLELRKTTAYTNRFKGNEIRRAANLNVLSEAEYLALEDSYNETLRSYGLQGYFGTDRKVATAAMSDIIGNDISAVEFKDRIDTVVTRVNNSDPNIKDTLRKFYNITDTDLVKYFLNPKEALPTLKEKVTSAEIGSEFIKQGLVTGVESATEYAKLGIDKATAAKGAETIAAVLPETTKLSNIYAEEGIKYSQTTAEEEILKNLDSARRKRLRLAKKEIGSFSGAAGLSQTGLRSQTRSMI